MEDFSNWIVEITSLGITKNGITYTLYLGEYDTDNREHYWLVTRGSTGGQLSPITGTTGSELLSYWDNEFGEKRGQLYNHPDSSPNTTI